jgi:hypothetical protein
MFTSTGILRYGDDPCKLVLEIDQQISDYYLRLLPKSISYNRQKYRAHVSVVRKEIPVNMEFWRKYEGEEVEFFYEGIVRFSENYCWLNVFSVRLEEIRLELGLPVDSPFTLPPAGFSKCYHTTIGNFKNGT